MCKLCSDRIHVHHDSSIEPQLDFKKHGDGINDPKLVEEHDLLFSGIFGSGVSRREILKMGGLAALGGLVPSAATFAQEKNGTRWFASAISRLPMPRPCSLRTKWASSRSTDSSRSRRR